MAFKYALWENSGKSQKKQYDCSFRGKQESRFKTLFTLKMLYIRCSTKEAEKFPEKMSFTPAIWVRSDEVKSRIRIQDIFYFESFM